MMTLMLVLGPVQLTKSVYPERFGGPDKRGWTKPVKRHVLGIVRLQRVRIGDGCGLEASRDLDTTRPARAQASWIAWSQPLRRSSEQTDLRRHRWPLSTSIEDAVHGGPRDGAAAMTGSIRSIRAPQASQDVMSRAVLSISVSALIGAAAGGATTPK